MPVTTTHRFIDQYPVRQTDTRMIVGTIHPHRLDNFRIPFFYGNVGSFWDLLHHAFPHHQIMGPESIELGQILAMLEQNNLWVTDIVRRCDRAEETVTRDDLLYNIVPNTDQIRHALLNTRIDTIYFTSGFGRNNAAKLFTQEFGINHLPTFDAAAKEFTIAPNHFGREIRCVVLYSPSNAANVGISRALQYRNNLQHYQQFPTPVKRFKVDFYRHKFPFLN